MSREAPLRWGKKGCIAVGSAASYRMVSFFNADVEGQQHPRGWSCKAVYFVM